MAPTHESPQMYRAAALANLKVGENCQHSFGLVDVLCGEHFDHEWQDCLDREAQDVRLERGVAVPQEYMTWGRVVRAELVAAAWR